MFQVLTKVSQEAQAPFTQSNYTWGYQISLVNVQSGSLTSWKVLTKSQSHGHQSSQQNLNLAPPATCKSSSTHHPLPFPLPPSASLPSCLYLSFLLLASSSHTCRRAQYVTQQQQTKHAPATSVQCTFSPRPVLHYQPLALMAMWGIQQCDSLKTKHEQPWEGVSAAKQIFLIFWSLHASLALISKTALFTFNCSKSSPHHYFCPGKVLLSYREVCFAMPCCDFAHLSTAHLPWWRGKRASMSHWYWCSLRVAITLGIFWAPVNTTALEKPYTKEISEFQLLLLSGPATSEDQNPLLGRHNSSPREERIPLH